MAKVNFGKYNYAAIVVGAIVVGSLLASLVVIKPLASNLINLNKKNKEKSIQLQELQAKEQVLLEKKDQEAQLAEDSETVSNALPSENEIGGLFIQLDAIAKASGGSLKSVMQTTGGTSGMSKNIVENSYSIPLEMPTYFALKQFMTSADSALRLLTIESMKIDASDSGSLTVNLIAKSYARAN